CRNGQTCKAGKCSSSCSYGLKKCDNTCANTYTDDNNCGSCGNKCKSNEICQSGKCCGKNHKGKPSKHSGQSEKSKKSKHYGQSKSSKHSEQSHSYKYDYDEYNKKNKYWW
ncbi:20807_t:CDS:2, partial [Gigaspora margarita]